MAASGSAASHASRRRWASVVALSAGLHVLVLGGLAFRAADAPRQLSLATFDVGLAPPPPFAVPRRAPAAPAIRATQGRIVPIEAAPRFAPSARASTGEAADALDLFGPVFADGMWPRPAVMARTRCAEEAESEPSSPCRRELLLMGLASEPAARSNAGP